MVVNEKKREENPTSFLDLVMLGVFIFLYLTTKLEIYYSSLILSFLTVWGAFPRVGRYTEKLKIAIGFQDFQGTEISSEASLDYVFFVSFSLPCKIIVFGPPPHSFLPPSSILPPPPGPCFLAGAL